jgi:hypothetical protein
LHVEVLGVSTPQAEPIPAAAAAAAAAQDRVHRLGQVRPVSVWRYVAIDTIEERMLELQVTANFFPSTCSSDHPHGMRPSVLLVCMWGILPAFAV